MTRAQALTAITVAGYHGDAKAATRLYVEHRISYAGYLAAWRAGQARRAAGARCTCPVCAPKEAPDEL